MKIEELRIGNWVEPITIGPSRVTSIKTQTMIDGTYISISVDEIPFLQEHVDPIPLTEKWLFKFGFEIESDYGDSKDYFHPRTRDFYVSIDHDEIAFKYNAKSGYYCIFYADDRLQFVHQLQNLYFALTGEELTITNQ